MNDTPRPTSASSPATGGDDARLIASTTVHGGVELGLDAAAGTQEDSGLRQGPGRGALHGSRAQPGPRATRRVARMSQRTSTPRQRNTQPPDTPGRIRNALGPFGMVPAGVVESGLSDAAVRLYAYLWRRTQNENEARPAQATIAAHLGWSRPKAKRTLEELVQAALLTVVPRWADDGSQLTNDYLLEWSSDFAPVVAYPEKPTRKAPEATPLLFSEEDAPPEEDPQGTTSDTTEGGGFTHDPGVTSEPGVIDEPGVTHDPQGGHPRPPKKTTPLSPSKGGRGAATNPADGGTAAPATSRMVDAWKEAYLEAHTAPPVAADRSKAARTAGELLSQGQAPEVVTAAARAAGAAGSPWMDRYVSAVTRVPGAVQAVPVGRVSAPRRTYGAPAQDSTPTPTATKASEACPTHPGYPAGNCGGCRADAIGDDSRTTRPYVDMRATQA